MKSAINKTNESTTRSDPPGTDAELAPAVLGRQEGPNLLVRRNRIPTIGGRFGWKQGPACRVTQHVLTRLQIEVLLGASSLACPAREMARASTGRTSSCLSSTYLSTNPTRSPPPFPLFPLSCVELWGKGSGLCGVYLLHTKYGLVYIAT